MDVVVATVLGGMRERREREKVRGRKGLRSTVVVVVVIVVVVMKHKSVVVVRGYKIEAMIGSGGGHKRPIDGCGRCLRNGKHRLWVLVVV